MLARLSLWLGFLSILCLEVLAGGLPGGLERVHLWEAYDLAWEWKGDGQTYLFPVWEKHKALGVKPVRFPAADKSGRFTFQEFISNMDGKLCEVEAPGPGRDSLTVAKALNDKEFNKDINGKGFNRGLESKVAKEKKSYYFALHEMVAKMVEDIEKDTKFLNSEGVKERIERMKKIPQMIEPLRTDDFQNWLKGDLTRSPTATRKEKGKDVPNPGFGLKDDEVVLTDPVTNELDGKAYQKVDVDATVKKMKKNPDYSKKKIEDFRQYCEKYGDVKWSPNDKSLKFADAATSHFQTLAFWGRMKERFNKCLAPPPS